MLRCSTDGNKPDVSLEDASLIRQMFSLFHGSEQKNAQLPPDRKVQPASPAVRAKLMGLLKRSLVAANSFPDNLQVQFPALTVWCLSLLLRWLSILGSVVRIARTCQGDAKETGSRDLICGTIRYARLVSALQAIFACVFEARGTLRLKHSGMEFAVWTFKHASQEPLERAAKPALQGLLMLLDNGGMPSILQPHTWYLLWDH